MLIHFEKFHGCGNDFIIIDNTNSSINPSPEAVAMLCDRHTGVGADGLILIEIRDGVYYMNYYNADGSLAEICGNGLRCSAKYIYNYIDDSSRHFALASKAGLSDAIVSEDGLVSITLPKASFKPEDIGIRSREPVTNLPSLINGRMYRLGYASMGNPHMVIFGEQVDRLPVKRLGPEYEHSNSVENGVNVNFAQIHSRDHISVETWERGSGLTLACGTGACASASILHENGLIDNEVTVSLPGGDLRLILDEKNITMLGPAVNTFSGAFEVEDE